MGSKSADVARAGRRAKHAEGAPGGARRRHDTRRRADEFAVPRWLPPLIALAATALAFANAAPDVLVHDDKIYVPEVASCTLSGLFGSVPWASEGLGGPFRPVSMGTICLEAALHGGTAWRFHATNIGLHLAVTLLVYLLALGMLRDAGGDDRPGLAPLAAGAAALVFGVHPVHTEAVDSVFNRSEVVATLLVLGGLLWLRRFADRRPVVAWSGAGVLYAGALLAKESGVSFPVLAALLLAVRHAGQGWRVVARRVAPAATLLVPLAAYVLLRQHMAGTVTHTIPHAAITEGVLTPAKRLAYLATTLGDTLRLLVWPAPLRASYQVYQPHHVALAVLAVLALAVLSVWLWRRAPALGVGVAWLVTALLVSTRLVTDVSVAGFAERFLYLPSVGPTLALAAGFSALATRAGGVAVVLPALLLGLVLGLVTRQRNLDWHDNVRLWEHDTAVAPDNGLAWMHLTTNLHDRGQHTRIAQLCADHLTDPSPENGQFLNNCGLALKALGRYDEAEPMFRRAIALGEATNVYVNLGAMLARVGRREEAEQMFEQAIAGERSEAMQHVRRGQMLAIVHPERAGAARAEFEAALRVSPGFKPALSWLARLR